jgi:diaminopimelate epimerase
MKMHGLGNDFVVIDSRKRGADSAGVVTAGLALALGDRNRGVGFDQLAEIRDAAGADFALDFWNSDGTRAGACGNATRCVSDYMMRQLGRDAVTLVTARGGLSAVRRGDGLVSGSTWGQPQLDWDRCRWRGRWTRCICRWRVIRWRWGWATRMRCIFVPDAEAVDLAGRGRVVEHDPLFPQRTNVEFASDLALIICGCGCGSGGRASRWPADRAPVRRRWPRICAG